MKLTSKPLAAIVVIILFGGIAFSALMGWWQTESTKEPAKYTEGEFAGQANPADIRGSYTFADIQNAFGIEPAVLAQAFGIQTDDEAAFAIKSLEEIYAGSPVEIGTSSVRLFVAFYAGLPFDLTLDIYLPQSAVDVLSAKGSLTEEQSAYLASHTAGATPVELAPEPASTPEAVSTPEVESETTLKGKTTFQELLDWGVSQETIETVIGYPMPNALTKVKDFCTEKGLSFETVKVTLQAEIDKVTK